MSSAENHWRSRSVCAKKKNHSAMKPMTSTWYMVTVKKSCVLRWSLLATMVLSVILTSIAGTPTPVLSSSQLSLDGPGWRLATDPKNVGRDQRWFAAPRTEALPTQVPWIIQDAFPGYHGVAWYWREFLAPAHPHADGRYLLRCWAVDYQAEVWVNGLAVGSHEGGETPFLLDVCLLYTSPSPRDRTRSRMPSSA